MTEDATTQVPFKQLFQENHDGTFSPRESIVIGCCHLSPGEKYSASASFKPNPEGDRIVTLSTLIHSELRVQRFAGKAHVVSYIQNTLHSIRF